MSMESTTEGWRSSRTGAILMRIEACGDERRRYSPVLDRERVHFCSLWTTPFDIGVGGFGGPRTLSFSLLMVVSRIMRMRRSIVVDSACFGFAACALSWGAGLSCLVVAGVCCSDESK